MSQNTNNLIICATTDVISEKGEVIPLRSAKFKIVERENVPIISGNSGITYLESDDNGNLSRVVDGITMIIPKGKADIIIKFREAMKHKKRKTKDSR